MKVSMGTTTITRGKNDVTLSTGRTGGSRRTSEVRIMATKKKFRIQRWSQGRDKWIFWLGDVYDKEKLAIAEVQDLNQGREYIREGNPLPP